MTDAVNGADATPGSRSLASSGIADPDAIDDKLLEEIDAGSSKMWLVGGCASSSTGSSVY